MKTRRSSVYLVKLVSNNNIQSLTDHVFTSKADSQPIKCLRSRSRPDARAQTAHLSMVSDISLNSHPCGENSGDICSSREI